MPRFLIIKIALGGCIVRTRASRLIKNLHHKPPKRQSPHRPRKSVGALGGIRKSPPCTLNGLQKAIKPQVFVLNNKYLPDPRYFLVF